MIKAVKEAKLHTSWLTPNEEYEAAVRLRRSGAHRPGGRFLDAFLPFQARVAVAGMVNSLAQVTLKSRIAGRAGLLSGHRAVGSEPGRSRQPPAGGLRRRRRLLADVEHRLALSPGARAGGVCRHGGLAGRARQDARHRGRAAAAARAARTVPVRRLPAARHGGHVGASLVAFARTTATAPRCSSCRASRRADDQQRLPVGGERWKTSRVLLPPELRGGRSGIS